MENEMKNLLCNLVLIMAAAALAATSASAAVSGDYEYTDNGDGTCTITDYTGSGGTVSIPASLDGLTVITIGDYAFRYCYSLTDVTIPDSVTAIGDGAFYSCDILTSVTTGNSVTTIGDYAFDNCDNLTSVIISDSVTTIGYKTFGNCGSLTSVIIPNSVTIIGGKAFYTCDSLTSVTIGNSVTTIGDQAFAYCYILTSVTIPDSVISIGDEAFYDCDSLTTVTIPDSVTTIGDEAFNCCDSLTGVSIPDSVITIGNSVFQNCNSLTGITVDPANSVYCDIDGVLFNKSQTELIQYPGGKYGSYSIPDGVTIIRNNAFWHCDGLTGVTIPNSVTTIGGGSFYYCDNLISVTIPNSVSTIGDNAFYSCSSLANMTIGNNVTTIGIFAFSCCDSLTDVTIPNSVTTIEGWMFSNCDSLTNVTIPDSVITIGRQSFSGCYSLSSITIPDSVTAIEALAFTDCDSLTDVTIPDSVTTIGSSAFSNCDSLNGVYFRGDCPVSVGYDVFYGSDPTVYYIAGTSGWGSEFADRPTATWTGETDGYYYRDNGDGTCILLGYTGPGGNITIPDSLAGLTVTTIGDRAFRYCDSLTGVIIPNSVTTIGDDAFGGCNNLTDITVDLTNSAYCDIGGVLFNKSQTKLVQYPGGRSGSYSIPNGVTTIGNYTFSDCDNLTGVAIPDSVTTIEDYVFKDCYSLTGVTIPNSITTIGDLVFSGCASLTGVYFRGDCPTSVGNNMFSYSYPTVYYIDGTSGWGNYFASRPTAVWTGEMDGYYYRDDGDGTCALLGHTGPDGNITIPDSLAGLTVVTVENEAFLRCYRLTGVTIPDSVTTIGHDAFAYCDSLSGVTIGNSVTAIGDYAFYNCDSLTGVYFKGDCPASVSSYVFYSSYPTVYYMSGTSGWGSEFAGRPTAIWPASIGMTGSLIVDMEIDDVGGLEVLEIDVFAVSEAVGWTISGQDDCSWIISVSPDTGSSTGPTDITAVQITIDTAGLAVGDYTHRLSLEPGGDDGYWLPLSVEVHVCDTVDLKELAILAAYWGDSGCADEMSPCHEADFYRDGVIDVLDLMQLAISWLGEEMIYASNWTDYLADFSDGTLPTENWTYNSTNNGRIQIVDERLRMDCSTNGTYSLNEAILHLDLEGQSEVMLSFWQAESGDELHSLPTTFSGSYNGDGVAVSPDGVNWTTVVNASALDVGTAGSIFTVDLDALGLEYTSDFQIKFQQCDNYTWGSDGREWDNIRIYKNN